MNKIDCLADFKPRFDRDKEGRIFRVWISAQSGDGIDFTPFKLSNLDR
jgi:GTP-binding protein HflX